MADFCPDCGKNLALVGRVHRCYSPSAPRVDSAQPLFTSPPDIIVEHPKRRGKSNAERQAKWRETHTDMARQRTRDGMRKLRAKEHGGSTN